MDSTALSKTLHYLIENFMSGIKSCFEQERIELTKVYCELVKRSPSIVQDIRSIGIYVNKTFEISDATDAKVYMNARIQELTENVLQQDFAEFAMSGDSEFPTITEDQLHKFLHSGAMTDVLSLSPSSLSLSQAFSFLLTPTNKPNMFDGNKNVSCLLPSLQFDKSRLQMENEIGELRRIMENGFSVSDLNSFSVTSILKSENLDTIAKPKRNASNIFEEECASQPDYHSIEFDSGMFENLDFDDSDNFLSWEGCLGNFLPDHLFISEVTPEAALVNIPEKESQAYYTLINSQDAITEEDMVHDIFDLMIGIASDTFYYDIHARRFRIKSALHLPNLSPECTVRLVTTFLESGSVYYLLQKFSSDSIHAGEGLVYKGFQLGVQQVLSIYKEHIVTMKANSRDLLSLRKDVAKNAEILKFFGAICGIDLEKMSFIDIPKGLGLICYLHDLALSHRRSESEVMIAILFKYAYAPYFGFLNKWLTEGVCDDPFGEFQIMEDVNYLSRRDAMYWKFAYTENIDDVARSVPPDIKSYSQQILDCGKNIGLLKICCPNLFFLKFLFYKPPPSLSMVYSFPAVICKLRESLEYVALKEKTEDYYEIDSSEVSVDKFYTECQALVDRSVMMNSVKRRWDTLYVAEKTKSNICSYSQIKQLPLNSNSTEPPKETDKISEQKWKSLCSLETTDKDSYFSGKIYTNIGLLFSSCGFNESKLENSLESFALHPDSCDFSRQLDLLALSPVFADKSLNCLKYWKVSLPQMEFLNSEPMGPISTLDVGHKSCKKTDYVKPCENFKDLLVSKNSKKKSLEVEGTEKNDNKHINLFVVKLASLLISKYSDSTEDVSTCLQVTSLHRLLMHNFNVVLNMRVHLVESTLMKYFIKHLKLDVLLSNLRKIYFLQDGIFCQSLCNQLFDLVMKCKTPRGFANWAVLYEFLQHALCDSNRQSDPFFAALNVNVISLPDEMPIERLAFLHMFLLEYDIAWPLNVIVHPVCQAQYLKIFSTLLELEFLCWLFGCTWRMLMMTSKELHLDDSPQFQDVMLNRFDMEQFIRTIRNSIHHHLQGPLWEFMQKSLSVEESSIDQLESIHMQYLEKALARCFLTDETHVLHEMMYVMLRQMYKFCSTVYECNWEENVETGQYETIEFDILSSSFKMFKQYQAVFLKRILKETLTKKFGRHWDKNY